MAWCAAPRDLMHEGGGWYTTYTSHFPESGGNIRLYRRLGPGMHLLVDERVHVIRFYQPDCILYEPGREAGLIHAACGRRTPVPVAFYPPWSMHGGFEATDDGLQRTDTVKVIDGRPIATMVRYSMAGIRQAADTQPQLFPGSSWRGRSVSGTVRPEVRDEPVDVAARGRRGTTPLINAVRAGQLDVIDALLRHGADVNARDESRSTALLLAVNELGRDTLLVRRLLQAGADPNLADVTETTPLLWAALRNKTAVFRMLLGARADPCRANRDGKTILDYAEGPFPELQRMANAAYAPCRRVIVN